MRFIDPLDPLAGNYAVKVAFAINDGSEIARLG
jgi:hypothetical protein